MGRSGESAVDLREPERKKGSEETDKGRSGESAVDLREPERTKRAGRARTGGEGRVDSGHGNHRGTERIVRNVRNVRKVAFVLLRLESSSPAKPRILWSFCEVFDWDAHW